MRHKTLILIVTLGYHATWSANPPYCLFAEAEKGGVRLQFTLPSAGEIGEVRYQRGSGAIAVKRVQETPLKQPKGRPWLFETLWKEIVPPYGTYKVVSQGAVIYLFEYSLPKRKQPLSFTADPSSFTPTGCAWQRKQNGA